jgi:hypothetical protein
MTARVAPGEVDMGPESRSEVVVERSVRPQEGGAEGLVDRHERKDEVQELWNLQRALDSKRKTLTRENSGQPTTWDDAPVGSWRTRRGARQLRLSRWT